MAKAFAIQVEPIASHGEPPKMLMTFQVFRQRCADIKSRERSKNRWREPFQPALRLDHGQENPPDHPWSNLLAASLAAGTSW
jgi:hypothetical protein